jgi:hypothetical protein
LSAVTGQTGPVVLAQAGLHALALVDAMVPFIGSAEVLPAQHVVAHVGEAGTSISASTASSASMLTWPGVTATRVLVPAQHVPKQARRGTTVGHVVISMGTQKFGVPVHLDGDIPPQTLLQRLS